MKPCIWLQCSFRLRHVIYPLAFDMVGVSIAVGAVERKQQILESIHAFEVHRQQTVIAVTLLVCLNNHCRALQVRYFIMLTLHLERRKPTQFHTHCV